MPKQPEPLLVEFSSTQTHDYSNMAELYEDHHAGIVTVYTYSAAEEKQSVATGMLITKDGYLISCTHIYDDIPNAKFSIVLSDGSMHPAVFVTGDVESDICLLKIVSPDRNYPIVQFGDSDETRPGDKCVIMGFPGGASVEPIITSGIISSMDVRHSNLTGYLNSYIQTDAIANPGNSGGGLFNMKGQVIGIITSKYTQSNYEGTIYSISSKTIKQVINDLFYTGYVSRPTLGITFTTTTNLELDQGLPYGSKVVEVKDTSKAFGLLNSGDIILEVNGKAISPAYELYDVLLALPTDNPELTCKVYNPETKETKTVTFSATMRYSSTGYKQE
jgi:serine protease Do